MSTQTETGDVTGTKDKDYNIIWFTEACLDNALRLETYVGDAERDGDDASWIVPEGGHHVWVTLHRAIDERALYVEALHGGVAFLPGGAVMAEKSTRTSMRLSFGLLEPELLEEGVRRLAVALREVRRRGRVGATASLS